LAAASNTDGPEVIDGIIDRQKQAAFPFSGPPLVSEYYRRVPLGSIVWTIARTPSVAGSPNRGELLLPGSWAALLPRGSIVIASARPLAEVHLRAEVLAANETEARNFTDRMSAFLALFKSLDISMDAGGPDPDVKAAFQSIEVRQQKNEAVLTAKVPFAFFRKILSDAPVELGGQTQKPPEANAPTAKPNAKKKK
jgi:hypothetical protein